MEASNTSTSQIFLSVLIAITKSGFGPLAVKLIETTNVGHSDPFPIKEFVAEASMNNTWRWVNIRGYRRKVKVLYLSTKSRFTDTKEWVVQDGDRREIVPEHVFYHIGAGGLLEMRDTTEFKRYYGEHPIEVEKLPAKKV